MTKRIIFILSSGAVLAVLLAGIACNVPPQQPMKTTGAVFDPQRLRTTPLPCGPDQNGNLQACEAVNYILTNGQRSSVDASWTFPGTPPATQTTNIPGTYNTAVILDQPVIFGKDCDASKITYSMQWVMLDENGQDLQTTNITTFLPAVKAANVAASTQLTAEVGVNYVLRLHVTGMDQCSRISFKFEALEIAGYTPTAAPAILSSDPTNPQFNVAVPKLSFLPEFTEDFQFAPPAANVRLMIADPTFVGSPCDPSQYQVDYNWVTTSQTGQISIQPIKNPQTDFVTTDSSQKMHALRVHVSNIAECRRAAFSFAVVPGPSPSPTPAPSPTPVPLPTASASATPN